MENGSECTRSIDYELEISMRVIDDEGAARVSYVNHLQDAKKRPLFCCQSVANQRTAFMIEH